MADPKPARDLGKRMMNQAFVVTAMVGVIFYFVYSGKVELDDPVTLEVKTTQANAPLPDGKIPLTLAIKLSNNTKDGKAFTAPSECETFNWFLTDTAGEFVQAKPEAVGCTKQSVSTWLDANKAMQENVVLELDPHRVHPGDYHLSLRYWGQETIQNVTIK